MLLLRVLGGNLVVSCKTDLGALVMYLGGLFHFLGLFHAINYII